MKNIGIVTGASSGMGRDFAIETAKNFDIDELWIVARRKERLIKLANYIYENYAVNVVVIPADLTNYSSIQKIQNRLENEKPNVKILINSSGYGLSGKSNEIKRELQENMIILNCLSLFSITNICTNYMSRDSGIIQISSSAGFCPQPFLSVYSATKAFVLNYSLAIAQELKEKGIKVSVVCPGPVQTEFFDVLEQNSNSINIYKKMFIKKSKYVVNKTMKGYIKGKNLIVPGFFMKLISIVEGMPIRRLTSIIVYKIFKKFNQ